MSFANVSGPGNNRFGYDLSLYFIFHFDFFFLFNSFLKQVFSFLSVLFFMKKASFCVCLVSISFSIGFSCFFLKYMVCLSSAPSIVKKNNHTILKQLYDLPFSVQTYSNTKINALKNLRS